MSEPDDHNLPSGPRARFPPAVRAAGIIWIWFGILGLIGAVGVFVYGVGVAAQVGGDGLLVCCAPSCIALFALVFLIAGILTVKGTAKGTLGIGIGSIIFGFLHLGIAAVHFVVVVGMWRASDAVNGLIYGLSGAALLTAGALAVIGRSAYDDWRETQGLTRPRRRSAEEIDYDDRDLRDPDRDGQ